MFTSRHDAPVPVKIPAFQRRARGTAGEEKIDDMILERVRSSNDELVKNWKHVAGSWNQILDGYPEPVKNVLDELCVICKEYGFIVSKEMMTDVEVLRADDIIKMLVKKYLDKMDDETLQHFAVRSMVSWILLTPVRSSPCNDPRFKSNDTLKMVEIDWE
jgi:hypothetical protein